MSPFRTFYVLLALTLAAPACTTSADNTREPADGSVDVGLNSETTADTRPDFASDFAPDFTTDVADSDVADSTDAGPTYPIVGPEIATSPTAGVVCKGVTCRAGTDCCDGVAGATCIDKTAECIAPPAWCSGKGGGAATCPAPRATCDGNEDCKSGEVCCADDSGFNTRCQLASSCKATSRVCHNTGECATGEHCCGLLYPFPTSGLCQTNSCTSGLAIGGAFENSATAGVRCGDKTCPICCDARAGTGMLQCVDGVTSCKRQINTCDGAEDCKAGEDCCIDYSGFGACKTKGTCTGTRLAVACHKTGDCGAKESCCSFSGVGVCESTCR